MIPVLHELRLVPGDRLVLHEAHDPRRLALLKERILAEGVQRNPIVVSPFGEDYLVLDGAHRFRALSELGCGLVLVQLARPPAVVESWGHLVLEDALREVLGELEGVELSGRSDDPWLFSARFSGGEEIFVRPEKGGVMREVGLLWELQRAYRADSPVRRVEPERAPDPAPGEALVRYRRFSPGELLDVVGQGEVLPAGITRFRIGERVLGVCFPLEKMEDGAEDERNAELRRFVEERWESGKVRRYDEPVVLFE
ncbi:ParB N-terminal domain-containing protein [Rubrobacter calidifluminis]|uniref:ParB N-terminal domain-containing protein n=1 Tax=Rubrobacter calidifluminis TaxID=1392640 RepID=UPI00235FED88|nr:ParB N-terminal domain-containing protein [Rubrobacter calidifluminis]